jgi:hypothetical protein
MVFSDANVARTCILSFTFAFYMSKAKFGTFIFAKTLSFVFQAESST